MIGSPGPNPVVRRFESGARAMNFSALHLSLLTFGVAVAAASDVACRRIPNQLTLPLAVAGVVVSGVTFGVTAIVQSVAAATVMALVLVIAWRAGMLGGGDVKIGIAAATWVGWRGLVPYVAWSGLFLGVLSVVAYLASAREARVAVRANLAAVAQGHAIAPPLNPRDARVPVPAGVALGAGALATILLRG
jgi:prepilin peptidase CpaA